MSRIRPSLIMETCLMCDRMAPARFQLLRSPDVFGHEKAPAQRRNAPLCTNCHDILTRAGARGLVETASGARWTLASTVPPAQRASYAPMAI